MIYEFALRACPKIYFDILLHPCISHETQVFIETHNDIGRTGMTVEVCFVATKLCRDVRDWP